MKTFLLVITLVISLVSMAGFANVPDVENAVIIKTSHVNRFIETEEEWNGWEECKHLVIWDTITNEFSMLPLDENGTRIDLLKQGDPSIIEGDDTWQHVIWDTSLKDPNGETIRLSYITDIISPGNRVATLIFIASSEGALVFKIHEDYLGSSEGKI